jgi:phosphoribosylpyrophosphate synthetase
MDDLIARGAAAAKQSEALKRHTNELIAAMDDHALLAAYVAAERTHDKDRVQRIQHTCLVRAVRERIPAQQVLAALNKME